MIQVTSHETMSFLVPALTGGLAGALVTLFMQKAFEVLRIWHLSKKLKLEKDTRLLGHFRVCNYGMQTVEDAIVYISLTFDPKTDIIDNMEEQAFIAKHNRVGLCEDRLSWAVAAPVPNPLSVNIYPGEKQLLPIIRIHPNQFEIPSEQGMATQTKGKKSRVFLKIKRYKGSLYIVARNTLRRDFDLVVALDGDVTLTERPLINFLKLLLHGTHSKTSNA